MSKYKEDILKLRSLGYTYNQIVNELGCTKSTVCYYLGKDQSIKRQDRQRDRRNKIKKHIQELKQNSSCADCGENYPYWIMEFDHLRDKKFGINNAYLYYTFKEIIEEINKCEIVCANCHRNRTYLRSIKSGAGGMDISEFYN